MKTPRNFGRLATLLVLGMALISLVAPRAAAQKSATEVRVVNAAADPVPVKIDPATNTVKIDGTVNTVKASQAGAWNVGIAGTPTVVLSGASTVSLAADASVQIGNAANSPVLVRDVDRPSEQPIRANLSATFNAGFAASTVDDTYTVPGGKRLVVEFVTVNITLPNGQTAMFARLDSSGFNQYLALTILGNDATNKPVFIGTHRVFTIYEPGTIVEAFGVRNSGTGGGTLTMTISGYLTDL